MKNNLPKVIVVIPARMDSKRFPGKPLKKILGISMIEHVYSRAVLCKEVDYVLIATCDQEIMNACKSFGAKAVLTSAQHERSVDRVAEAAKNLNYDIVVNLQGDEPQVTPDIIQELINSMKDDELVDCANLVSKIDKEEFISPNTVKIVNDVNDNILYFSREPIPSKSKSSTENFDKYRQIGIMAFRKNFLLKYTELPSTPLEKIESVDMLRILEHGFKIKMIKVDYEGVGVDIPSDISKVEKLMASDDLLPKYSPNN
jgi:3-deoxy-manno-octulosonate cytidylyltransferase (CMP-KDO synthetase)